MVFHFQSIRMSSICLDGKIISAEQPILLASNRSYRYGDGLFETLKMVNGKMILWEEHFNRLQAGLSLLQFELPGLFSNEKLKQEIEQLCRKNNCAQLARIRLSVFRGNGGLYDENDRAQYLIECWPLNEAAQHLNENGLVIDIYPDSRKSCDVFSNLKSASFQAYSMGAQYAIKNKLNDCLVLNTNECIADSTIANLFIIKNGVICTPALTEGCVNGTTRNYRLEQLKTAGYILNTGQVTPTDVEMADEVFLTNSITGIRWVGHCGKSQYKNSTIVEIYNRFIRTIFS
jgi:branched-chain amino acid aminotransferase